MPLIRYRIGDMGIKIEERCSCGRSLPLLKMVEGRADDFLTTLDGRIISPSIFTPYPFRSLAGIRKFIIVQKERDKLLIQLAVKEDATIDHRILEEAKREIERVFGKGMRVDIQITDRFEKNPNGKLRQVISHVPVTWR
jgi:phenylacetate-CoA ligase